MRLSSGRLALAACWAFAWVSACGGEAGRRGSSDTGNAGEAGAPTGLGSGGSAAPPDAGAPGGGSLGAVPGSSGEAALGGGMGGEPNAAGAAGAAAGAPAAGASAGAPGNTAGAAGEGGQAGAPAICCEPLKCADVIGSLECALKPFHDGCGAVFFCGCPDGDECDQNKCVACDAGPDPCADDANLCGSTTDRCGNAIACADNCQSVLGPLGTCHSGYCCEITKTSCAADDCGYMSDGCGGFVDCSGSVCQTGTCQPNGKCCTPSQACVAGDCGFKPDGCGNYLDCGNPCTGDTLCMENHCVDDHCKLGALECDPVYNPEVDGYQYCGSCPQGEGCLAHQCVPLCMPAPR